MGSTRLQRERKAYREAGGTPFQSGLLHRKPRQQFLTILVEITGNIPDAVEMMSAMDLWANTEKVSGVPPRHVLRDWYERYTSTEEKIPDQVRLATLKQADAYMRWQVRRPMKSAADALIKVNERLQAGKEPPGGVVTTKYLADQLGFLGRVGWETSSAKEAGRIVMPGARLVINAGPKPRKLGKGTKSSVVEAEYKELPAG